MASVDKDSKLYRWRHSLAHVLAQAMQEYRPGTVLGFGPPVDDGFYYDFILPEPISEEDLPKIEKLMRKILNRKQGFACEDLAPDQALAKLEAMGEPHKVEYAKELLQREGIDGLRFYTNGPFVDMCEGPHVENTEEIPPDCFKLHAVAGAYWRGDEKRAMMTRVYGWAFEDRAALKAYQEARAEALKRDHRKLGAELDLFVIDDDIGKGLPLWLPNGQVLCQELEKLAAEFEFQDGYLPVRSPHITKGKLYEISGHLTLYKTSMFPPMMLQEDEGEEPTAYYLKPMNCPHHHKIFAARMRSYRDLPLRLAEYGTVYRYEKSGSLHGLTRVRGMCMNDAHIYITEDQIREEFIRVMELHRRYYDLFGLSNYYMRLSLWDPEDPKGKEKYVDDPPAWDYSQRRIREAMVEVGLPFEEVKGEAAFYGPKIDIQFQTVGLKEFTVSTNQLDFAVAKRFELEYTDRDGTQKTPYIIHRAPLGTHERFVSFLIEHFGGAFPTWLAPVQVRVLPLSEHFIEYADTVVDALRRHMIRAECDRSDAKLGKKIREGTTEKIPILLVVGEQEREHGNVTVRRYKIDEQRSFKIEAFVAQVRQEIAQRVHVTSWDDVP
ncbi:MAG: threonine--tRNA ligase [Planctomycetes bacterium]|nr:threonine--tRNA ligase [Planctomycetota bacterium]MCB9891911.1 threonine--tRNA ligase [Planctomycetota bacterium]